MMPREREALSRIPTSNRLEREAYGPREKPQIEKRGESMHSNKADVAPSSSISRPETIPNRSLLNRKKKKKLVGRKKKRHAGRKTTLGGCQKKKAEGYRRRRYCPSTLKKEREHIVALAQMTDPAFHC